MPDTPEDFSPDAPALKANDYIRLASTFHSMHAIAGRLSPVKSSTGIEVVETDTFRLQCYQTLTGFFATPCIADVRGIKFLLTADPNSSNLEATLIQVYQLYADYVLKNPFYDLDMPIHCALFETFLDKLVAERSS